MISSMYKGNIICGQAAPSREPEVSNEVRQGILAHALSSRRGGRMTYLNGPDDLIGLKKQYPQHEMVLHSDRGAVYASKAFNGLLPMYSITRSMSRAGTPTDNAAMESINGWIKAEIFMDFHVTGITYTKPYAILTTSVIQKHSSRIAAYTSPFIAPISLRHMKSPSPLPCTLSALFPR